MLSLTAAVALATALAIAPAVGQQRPTQSKTKVHQVVIQVDQNDPAVMNLALNNADNMRTYYEGKGQRVEIELVAFGPGLNMMRADTSPVKDRLAALSKEGVRF